MNYMTIFISFLLYFCSFSSIANTETFENENWQLSNNEDNTAYTYIKNNSSDNAKKLTLSYQCVSFKKPTTYNINLHILNNTGYLSKTAQLVSDNLFSYLSNPNHGIIVTFASGKQFKEPFTFIEPNFRGNENITGLGATFNQSINDFMKTEEWVDIDLIIDNQPANLLNPFSLTNSDKAIEQSTKNCI